MNSTFLKPVTLAAINENYPELELLQIYIDGAKVGMYGHAGVGVYCQEFSH